MDKQIAFATMEKFDNRVVNSVGSSRIRARWLLPFWPEAEEYMMGRHYEAIIFQKVYWKAMMENYQGIKILDLCDPDWLEGKPVFEYIDLADAVTTSTPALRDYIQKMRPEKKVVCVPDRVYLPEHIRRTQTHEGIAKKVVWFGYSQNVHYLEQTFDELLKKNLELVIISNNPYVPNRAYQTLQITNVPFSYPEVNEEIKKADVVIMPEPFDEKGKFKSNNKTLQAWALGMPVAKSAEDLDRFMDGYERQLESDKRYQEILTDWNVELSVGEYKVLIEELKNGLR